MSSIRTVLVQLDATPAASLRLTNALAVAARHGAVLNGVFAATAPAAPMATAVSDEPAELLARADRAAYERAHGLFESMRTETAVPMQWREPGPEGGAADLLAEAPYADLLVLGVHDPARAGGMPAGLAERVLSTSGRPALLLPGGIVFEPEPRTVLLGWDASPAAVHALAAALPWLQAARRVLVLDGSPPAADDGPAPICRYLSCHRVSADLVHWPHANRGAGEALLAPTRREAVDLLAMGCFGHGRLHELLFGGASQSVLPAPPAPLLMAH
jgi:nucleotide-binding universal stress UspA family protein